MFKNWEIYLTMSKVTSEHWIIEIKNIGINLYYFGPSLVATVLEKLSNVISLQISQKLEIITGA